jgi:hypothetical protein
VYSLFAVQKRTAKTSQLDRWRELKAQFCFFSSKAFSKQNGENVVYACKKYIKKRKVVGKKGKAVPRRIELLLPP